MAHAELHPTLQLYLLSAQACASPGHPCSHALYLSINPCSGHAVETDSIWLFVLDELPSLMLISLYSVQLLSWCVVECVGFPARGVWRYLYSRSSLHR